MIWLKVLSFLNPKRIMYGLAAAATAFVIWQGVAFVSAKYAAEAAVAELTTELRKRDAEIRVLEYRISQRADAQDAADAARDEIENRRATYDEIRNGAASAKDEDNGPLAPVLRDALRSLDGMQPGH